MGDKTRVQLKQLICKGRTEQVELKKQLKQGHKKVQLQGDKKCVYLMMLDTPLNRREGKKAPERNISNCIYIQQPLGRGGFGIVYKAELMMKEKRKLCIKMALHKRKYKDVQDRAAGQEDINKSLLREAACYKKLSAKSHANVISMDFYCFSEDRNEVLLALEYCKGVNLSHIIKHYRNKSMPSKLLHKVMVESTLAIEYCLSHNIVHCDVKPPNILFSSMEAPLKLIDLGCAVDLDELMEGDRGVAGTWWYMAPEVGLVCTTAA
ncbi:uncharacterized protein [Watersipora subatra]|uniref:uncharacterized protein n=1 Tax=Watersipora subatra TaxID=2589382 RepID=UPI00355BBF9D